MLKNYIKIAWRNLLRSKSYALINLFGLAIGIASCLLILLWVADELSYDKWNAKADRIYRLTAEINFGGSHRHYANAPAPVAEALRNDFPEVETSVRFRGYGSSLVKRDIQNYKEENIIYTDSTVFDVFSLKMIKGDAKKALAPPNTVVINERTARKYFPDDEPVGKTLTFDNSLVYTITGVIEDMPTNSHFNFDFFVSLTDNQEANNGIWVSNNFKTYYVLKEGTNAELFQAKVYPHFLEKYIAPQIETLMGKPFRNFQESGAFIKYHHQPLTRIHLHSDLVGELAPNGNIQFVWIFSAVALFILLIACVNFMNLSTARSSLRAREIGLRKVMGSMRSGLIGQFLVESILMAVIALVLALMLIQMVLPYYNELADKQLTVPFDNIGFWGWLVSGILLVGLLAGSYPAFYLSAFKPIKTLSGRLLDKGGNLSFRNGLVVFQFFIAVLLIIGTLVIYQQMEFIQNKSLGYQRERVIIIEDAYALRNNLESFKKEILKNPQVINASISGFLPVPSNRSDLPLCKSSEMREDNCVSIQIWRVDTDYLSTMGMELAAGRNFSPDMPTDSNAVIINETAAGLFNFENPIGQKIYTTDDFSAEAASSMKPMTIIGVVKDFHYESLRENIGALSFLLRPSRNRISVKINTSNMTTLIGDIESIWKDMAPAQPFSYRFLDDSFDRIYRSEARVGKLLSIFSGLSIFIACLGLLGLAAFATERRTKEIGIRKILGASLLGIVGLLSKDFLKLVIIALIISSPLAWYFMNKWLESFAYRVNIEWWIFVIAAFAAIAIAFLTVSFQSIRAALANPVQSLRNE